MKVTATAIADVKLIEPNVHGDERGFFFESYNARALADEGIVARFVQDNHSRSTGGVLRGLHYQIRHAQGKLVRVVVGEVLDVAVDLRRSSPYFGRWVSRRLSARNRHQLWVPAGFAHGFVVLSDYAEFVYKATDYYAPGDERCIRWDDADLAIDWEIDFAPTLSAKDAAGIRFRDAEVYDGVNVCGFC